MAISSFTRNVAKTRPQVRSIEKDGSGILVKNIAYNDVFSNIENTASNRQTYPGSFDYTSFSSGSDTGDRFGNVDYYFNTILETSTWFRDTGSEST